MKPENVLEKENLAAPSELFGKNVPIIKAVIAITSRCNLKCKHCAVNAGSLQSNDELSTKEFLSFIDQFVSLGGLSAVITGGEPFCRKDILDVMEYMDESNISFAILTNGTMVSDEAIDTLASFKHLEYVQISLDGLKETHDAFRGVAGSYDKALDTIGRLCRTLKYTGVIVRSTLTRKNEEELLELPEILKEYGVDIFACEILSCSGRGHTIAGDIPTISEIKEFQRDLLSRYSNENRISVRPPLQIPPLIYPQRNYSPRGSCLSPQLIGLDPVGNIAPCPYLTRYKEWNVGNIKTKSLKEMWIDSDIKNRIENVYNMYRGVCAKCVFQRVCRGPCLANFLENEKEVFEDDLCRELYDEGWFPEEFLEAQ